MKSVIMILFCYLLIVILVTKTDGITNSCKLASHKDVTETITPTTTGNNNCVGKSVTVTLSNTYRGYCAGGVSHCESRDYAYHSGERFVDYWHCMPSPVSNEHSIIKHQNVPITCTSGSSTLSDTMDIYFINATNCKCGKLVDDYMIAS